MTQRYTATAKKNPGRKSWLVEFRHPLKTDNNNKPGKKTRKGLGTSSINCWQIKPCGQSPHTLMRATVLTPK